MAFDGRFFNLGDKRSLENTAFSTRHGFETLLRRLTMGKKQYPNIEQMVGTVTGVIPSDNDPTKLQAVSVRTSDGDRTIDASLIIGPYPDTLLTAFNNSLHRLLWCGASGSEMATACRFWGRFSPLSG